MWFRCLLSFNTYCPQRMAVLRKCCWVCVIMNKDINGFRYPWRTPSIWMFTHFCDTDHAVLLLEAQNLHLFFRECSLLTDDPHALLLLLLLRSFTQNCCNSRTKWVSDLKRIRAISAENQSSAPFMLLLNNIRFAANLWSKAAAALLYESNIASIITICPHCYCENKELYVIQRNQRL